MVRPDEPVYRVKPFLSVVSVSVNRSSRSRYIITRLTAAIQDNNRKEMQSERDTSDKSSPEDDEKSQARKQANSECCTRLHCPSPATRD